MPRLNPTRHWMAGIAVACIALLFGAPVLAGKHTSPEVNVLIRFKTHPAPSDHTHVKEHGGHIKHSHWIVPAVAASMPLDAVADMLRDPNVDTIEPDLTVHAVDLELDNAWGVKHIGAGMAHAQGQFGEGVKVAVIDTGIDYTHPDLNANFAGGWDFVNNDADPMDDNGHGTHVAGTIAGEDDGAGVVGVAPHVQLYALKVLDANGSGSFSNVIAAIEWCLANGIQVTNNSYGAGSTPGSTVHDAFDRAAAAGIVMVAAAGNSGTSAGTEDSVNYPAYFDSVIAVAATTSSDTRPSFSSTGPTVELAAPGYYVYSTVPGGGYGYKSGTSMACPHVVGVAALVIGAGLGDVNGNGIIGDDVRALLDATAIDLGTSGGDTWYGFGLVDAESAVELALATASPPTSAPVSDPAPAPVVQEVHVGSIDYALSGGRWNTRDLNITVTTVDNNSAPVSGAQIAVTLYRNGKALKNLSGATSANGQLTLTLKKARSATYSTLIKNIVADPLEWDGVTPANSFTK